MESLLFVIEQLVHVFVAVFTEVQAVGLQGIFVKALLYIPTIV
ncbi:MAG: hypothetical protein ACFB10_10530 [Salibacteraceae bacterium]